MKKLMWAAFAAVLAVVSCQPDSKDPAPGPEPAKSTISASVSEVTMFSVSVDVTVDENSTFYATIIKESDFKDVTPDSIADKLANDVDAGKADWSDFLKINSQTVKFENLELNTAYKVIAFGLNALGEITSEAPAVVEATTENFTVKYTVENLEMFGYDMKLDVNNQEVYYFATDMPYEYISGSENPVADYINDLLEEYAFYGEVLTFGDFFDGGYIFQGSTVCEDWYIEPGEARYWVAAMVDEDLNVISPAVISDPVESDAEGLELVDEAVSANGGAGVELYSYKGCELVFKFFYDEEDWFDFANYYYEINAPEEMSVYSWSDKEIADAMALGTQENLYVFMSDPAYADYFGEDWWENLYQYLYTAAEWPVIWVGEVLYYEEVDEPVQNVLLASTLENIDEEGTVYNVEYAVVRHNFAGNIVPVPASASVVKAPAASKNTRSIKAHELKANGAAKAHFASTGIAIVK